MKRIIPGSILVEGREFIYVECKSDESFHDFIEQSAAPYSGIAAPRFGGVIDEGVRIKLQDGTSFFGVSYRGDIEGWRSNIVCFCERHNRRHALIDGKTLIVSKGRMLSLEELQVEFENGANS